MKYLLTRLLLAAMLSLPFSAQATIPKVQEFISPNGIKFWSIEDNYLPIVSIKIVFTNSGAAYDPESKQGLANMVSNLLIEGAGGISGIDYMKQVEELASNLSFGVDGDDFYVSVTSLKENLDNTLRLLAIALKSPDFTDDAVARVRKNILSTLAKQEESPEKRARKTFQENFFAGHPYSRQIEGNASTINEISRKDLVAFANGRFTRSNMIVGVTGSITPDEIKTLLDKHFATLQKDMKEHNDIPEFIPGDNLGKTIKISQDVPHSVVIFGFPGPKRNDADFYPTYIMNHVLGSGGFESRLMSEVREKRGLAYTIYTAVQTYKKAGVISGYVATKNSSLDESLKIIRAEITKMYNNGINGTELRDAQDYLIGSFPLKMTQNAALASFITSMQNDRLGIDFLDKRNDYITTVNIVSGNEAAKKYLNPDKMLLVVVGKE